jgi:hypothetical protein
MRFLYSHPCDGIAVTCARMRTITSLATLIAGTRKGFLASGHPQNPGRLQVASQPFHSHGAHGQQMLFQDWKQRNIPVADFCFKSGGAISGDMDHAPWRNPRDPKRARSDARSGPAKILPVA